MPHDEGANEVSSCSQG